MERVQLALNVSDLDAAVDFYSKLFATEPAKRRPGYANFAVAVPPLKLVLIEGHGRPGTLNHLGVEVGSTDQVAAAHQRLSAQGLATGEPWEIYTVLGDVEHPAGRLRTVDPGADSLCCATAVESADRCC